MKKIVIGSVFVVFLLILMPSIPAVQYKTVVDTWEKIKNVDIDALEQKLKSINNAQIQEAVKSIDFSLVKQKINDFLAEEHTINVFYLIAFLLTLIYQIVLGRPSIVMGFFTVLSFIIVVQDFVYGGQTPGCKTVQLGFIPWVLLNLIGLIIYKTLPNKIIGFMIMVLFYLLSEVVVALAFSAEISSC